LKKAVFIPYLYASLSKRLPKEFFETLRNDIHLLKIALQKLQVLNTLRIIGRNTHSP